MKIQIEANSNEKLKHLYVRAAVHTQTRCAAACTSFYLNLQCHFNVWPSCAVQKIGPKRVLLVER